MLPILAATWHITLMGIAFLLVCVFMILVILIQKPKGGGLSGAFGGSGGSAQAAFGAKTGDVLTWFTVCCFVLFLGLAMGLTWAIRPAHQALQQQLQGTAGTSALEEAASMATEIPVTAPGEEPAGAAAEAAENLSDSESQELPVPTP